MAGPSWAKPGEPWTFCRGGFVNEDLHDSELGLHSASQSEKSTKKKKEEVLELRFWTINAGGHPGVWRLISLLESMTP